MNALRPSSGLPRRAAKIGPGYCVASAEKSVKVVPSLETSTTPPSTPTAVPSVNRPSKNAYRWLKVTVKLPGPTWSGGESRNRLPRKPGSGDDQWCEVTETSSWTMWNPSFSPPVVHCGGPSTSSVSDWFAATWKLKGTTKVAILTRPPNAVSATLTCRTGVRRPEVPAAKLMGTSTVSVSDGARGLPGAVGPNRRAGSEEVTSMVG